MRLIRYGTLPQFGNYPPRVPFGINRRSPQFRNLLAWWPLVGEAGRARELFKGQIGAFQNSLPLTATPERGAVPDFAVASSHYINMAGAHYASPITVSAWIRLTDASTSREIMGEWNNPGNTWLLYWWADAGGKISLNAGSDLFFVYPSASFLNQWHHVIMESTGQGYLDGIAQSMTGLAQSWSSTSNDFNIGKWGVNSWNGQIADARIYSGAIGAALARHMFEPQTRYDLYYPLSIAAMPFEGVAGSTTSESMSGSIAPAGTLGFSPTLLAAGAISPTGELQTDDFSATAQVFAVGAISPSGNLRRSPQTLLAGLITPAGALVAAQALALTGSLQPAGALIATPSRALSGNIAPAGSLRKTPNIQI